MFLFNGLVSVQPVTLCWLKTNLLLLLLLPFLYIYINLDKIVIVSSFCSTLINENEQ